MLNIAEMSKALALQNSATNSTNNPTSRKYIQASALQNSTTITYPNNSHLCIIPVAEHIQGRRCPSIGNYPTAMYPRNESLRISKMHDKHQHCTQATEMHKYPQQPATNTSQPELSRIVQCIRASENAQATENAIMHN